MLLVVGWPYNFSSTWEHLWEFERTLNLQEHQAWNGTIISRTGCSLYLWVSQRMGTLMWLHPFLPHSGHEMAVLWCADPSLLKGPWLLQVTLCCHQTGLWERTLGRLVSNDFWPHLTSFHCNFLSCQGSDVLQDAALIEPHSFYYCRGRRNS